MQRCFLFAALTFVGLLPALASAQAPPPPPEEQLPPARQVAPPEGVPAVPVAPGSGCDASCAPPVKTLSLPRYALSEEARAITIPVLNLREETVGVVSGMAVKYRKEKQTVIVMVAKPREIVKDMVVTEMVPVTVTDDCGKCHTEYQPCQKVHQIKDTVVDIVPEQREVEVPVPVMEPAPLLAVKRLTLDVTTQAALEKRLHLHTIPNEIAVPPAPCPALPPPLPH
jgi:hypothetical protein